jgi:hypothetical protein
MMISHFSLIFPFGFDVSQKECMIPLIVLGSEGRILMLAFDIEIGHALPEIVSLLLVVVEALTVKLHPKLVSLMVYVPPSLSKVFGAEGLVLPPVSTHLAISMRVVVIQLSRLPEIQLDVPILLAQLQLLFSWKAPRDSLYV